jgi:hypothetical protein
MLLSQGSMSELGSSVCSGTLLNLYTCSNFHLYLLNFQTTYLPPTHLSRKTSGHCLGTRITVNSALLSPDICSVSHYPPAFSSLSLSPVLKR